MQKQSDYLETAFRENNRMTPVQVVFADVKSYSLRRSVTQTQVVDAFMQDLQRALDDTAKEYIEYSQKRDINFANDVIRLPTGDGAAIAFPFDGIPDAHLTFARKLLNHSADRRSAADCEKFNKDGWCNCHPYYNLSIGVSEGRGVLFKDINGNFNLAGDVINMAARVMSQAGSNQILFTDEAFRQVVDMVEDPYLVEKFRTYEGVRIKHKLKITLHQYKDPEELFINSDPVEDLELKTRADALMAKLGSPDPDDINLDKRKTMEAMELLVQGLSSLTVIPPITIDAEVKSNPDKT